MKKIFKQILKIISTSIFVVLMLIIVLILFYVIRVQILSSQGNIDEIKLNFYTILTQSMYPTIDAGDIVITYKNANGVYKTGDIITFVSTASASKGLTITHRVTEVFNLDDVYSYKTQGDNNNIADSASVPSKNVIGKVIFKIPKAGYIQQFLVTKVGWVVAIVLPCLAIIIYDVLKMFKVLSGKKKTKNVSFDDSDSIKSKELLNKVISKEESESDSVDANELLNNKESESDSVDTNELLNKEESDLNSIADSDNHCNFFNNGKISYDDNNQLPVSPLNNESNVDNSGEYVVNKDTNEIINNDVQVFIDDSINKINDNNVDFKNDKKNISDEDSSSNSIKNNDYSNINNGKKEDDNIEIL